MNIFLDWNPLYADGFVGGSYENKPHQGTDDEPSLFAKLISEAKKL